MLRRALSENEQEGQSASAVWQESALHVQSEVHSTRHEEANVRADFHAVETRAEF